MKNSLYLLLERPDPDAVVEACVVEAGGVTRMVSGEQGISAVVAGYPGYEVIALIPGADGLSTRARLPKISAGKLRRSLPFALEDQLTLDLDAAHFAIGRTAPSADQSGVEVPVVVISRQRLRQWLDVLRAAGCEPAAIHLADDCVAAKPGDVVGWVRSGDEVFLRAPSGAAICSQADQVAEGLDILLAGVSRQTVGLQLFATAEQRARLGQSLESLAGSLARVGWANTATNSLAWLISQLPMAAPINLLQAEFLPRRAQTGLWQRWRLAALLAFVLFALHLGDRWFAIRESQRLEREIDTRILQAAQAVSPQLQSIEDAVTALGGAADGRAGSGLLRAAIADFAALGLSPQSLVSISLDAATVRIELRPGYSPGDLEQTLGARGWQVRAEEANGGVSTWYLIRPSMAGSP